MVNEPAMHESLRVYCIMDKHDKYEIDQNLALEKLLLLVVNNINKKFKTT